MKPVIPLIYLRVLTITNVANLPTQFINYQKQINCFIFAKKWGELISRNAQPTVVACNFRGRYFNVQGNKCELVAIFTNKSRITW